jgi:hypothetical protein
MVNRIARWDGTSWSALGSGMASSATAGAHVYALALDGANRLYVGGDFTQAGATVSPYIAQANLGGGTSPMGGAFAGPVCSPLSGFSCTFQDATQGQVYRIQVSPSLAPASWTLLTNLTFNGPVVIADPFATGSPARFYRAVTP